MTDQDKIKRLVDFIHATPPSGVCCCGDSMEDHADPYYAGHSPVDMYDYAVYCLLKELGLEDL